MRIQVIGACECGIATVELRSEDMFIDSGSTLTCNEGHKIIIDVWSPEEGARFFEVYAEGLLSVSLDEEL
jgi:hypothetical protein